MTKNFTSIWSPMYSYVISITWFVCTDSTKYPSLHWKMVPDNWSLISLEPLCCIPFIRAPWFLLRLLKLVMDVIGQVTRWMLLDRSLGGCYWTGHSAYGSISSSWSLTERVKWDCEEVMPQWMICLMVLECYGLVQHHNCCWKVVLLTWARYHEHDWDAPTHPRAGVLEQMWSPSHC